MKGYFITFEGGEGSGKSTVINIIQEELVNLGYSVLVTREPGGVKISEAVRNIILDKENNMRPETEALLYAASRTEHLYTKVLPNIEKGFVVISDRYLDSSLAYQGYGRSLGLEAVLNLNMFAAKYLPDRTYFFDVKPEIGLERIKNREKIDRLDLEKIEFHQRVYEGYQALCEMFSERILKIDGTLSIEAISKLVLDDLLKVINND